MTEIDETLKRIEGNKSVIGVLVLDSANRIIHQSLKSSEQSKLGEKLPPLIERARSMIKDMDATNDLTFLRIDTDKIVILVTQEEDYTLIVVQNAVIIDS